MAFNGLQPASGPFFLAPGGAMRIWVERGGGKDYGAQWIMADPNPEGYPVELTVSDFTKERSYRIGNTNGQYFDPYVRYWVTVRNTGTRPVHFTIQGGGNV